MSISSDIFVHRNRLILLEDRVGAITRREVSELVDRLVSKFRAISRQKSLSASDKAHAEVLYRAIRELRPGAIAGLSSIAAKLLPTMAEIVIVETARAGASLSVAGYAAADTIVAGSIVGISKAQVLSALRIETPHIFQAGARASAVDAMNKVLRREVASMFAGEKSLDAVTKAIAPLAKRSLGANAEALARTAVMTASNNAALAVYRKMDEVQYSMWSAAFDFRTCPRCGALNGRVYRKGNEPPMPAHPRCRCAWVPVPRGYKGKVDTFRKDDARLTAATDHDFDRWLRQQTPAVQSATLGSDAKWRAWKSNRVTLSELVSRDGSIRTDKELAAMLSKKRR